MSKAMIQLDHIDVTFQQKKRQIQAVKDVTIHINEGDIYGIVGYSGAGKSTLVRVINLLQVPSAGTITVDGDVIYQDRVTLKPAALREKRRDIGMIFQHFNLMAQMTVAENVAFALKHSKLNKEQNMTIVLVTHQMNDVSDYADHVIVIEAGNVVKEGSPKEVFSDASWLLEKQLGVPTTLAFVQKLKENGFFK